MINEQKLIQAFSKIKQENKVINYKLDNIFKILKELRKPPVEPIAKVTKQPETKQDLFIPTPTQKLILKTLLENEQDIYLSYKDIGLLTNRSAHAIRIHINKLEEKGISLEYITDINLQKRFKMPSKLKEKYNEVIQ